MSAGGAESRHGGGPAGLRWEHEVDGEWRPVAAASLPSWVKSKKSVLYAAAGEILEARDGERVVRYRLVATGSGT